MCPRSHCWACRIVCACLACACLACACLACACPHVHILSLLGSSVSWGMYCVFTSNILTQKMILFSYSTSSQDASSRFLGLVARQNDKGGQWTVCVWTSGHAGSRRTPRQMVYVVALCASHEASHCGQPHLSDSPRRRRPLLRRCTLTIRGILLSERACATDPLTVFWGRQGMVCQAGRRKGCRIGWPRPCCPPLTLCAASQAGYCPPRE